MGTKQLLKPSFADAKMAAKVTNLSGNLEFQLKLDTTLDTTIDSDCGIHDREVCDGVCDSDSCCSCHSWTQSSVSSNSVSSFLGRGFIEREK